MFKFLVKHIRDSFLPLKQLTCQFCQSQYPTKDPPFLTQGMTNNWAAEEGSQQSHPLPV